MAGKTIDNLKEIQKLVELLGKDIDRITFERLTNDIEFAKTYASELKSELNASLNVAEDLSSPFQKIQDGLTNGKTSLKDMNASMGKLKSLSQKVSDIKRGTTSIDEKGLNKLKEQLKVEKDKIASTSSTLLSRKEELKQKAKTLDITKSEFNQLEKINLALDEGVSLVNGTNEAFNDVENTLKNVNDINEEIDKKLGAAPKFAAGLDKALQKVGIPSLGIANALEKSKKEAQAAGRSTGIWVGFTKNLFKNIKKSFSFSNLLQGTFAFLLKTAVSLDKQAGSMAKSLNISYNEAQSLDQSLRDAALAQDNLAVSAEENAKTLMTINSAFGTTGDIAQENLDTFTALRKQSGMTNDELMGVYGTSVLTGKSMEDVVNSFQGTAKASAFIAGKAINTKTLMADISKTSKRFQLSTEGGASGLAKAMVNAKLLGVNMAEVEDIADNILNFEQSIENELSAELLLGKNITLEKARQAALNNDMATVAAEITKQAGSASEFSKMNRIQQEALAKAVGMTADGLSNALFEQEAIAAVGGKLTEKEQKAFETAKEKFGVEQATEMLKDGQLDKMLQQQATTEKLADVLDRIKQTFVGIVDGPLGAMMSGIANLLSNTTAVNIIFGSIATILGGKMLIGLTKTIAKLGIMLGKYISIAAVWALSNPLTALAGIAASAAVATIAYTYMNDGIIGPGGETIVSGPKGSIQLNKDDSMIVGTNLMGGNTTQQQSSPQSTSNTDMTQTNALLQQLINIVQAGGTVTLDGQKVGEALKLSSFQTQ